MRRIDVTKEMSFMLGRKADGDANKNNSNAGTNSEAIMNEAVLKLFNAYYRESNHSGKLYDDFPEFMLFKPGVLDGKEIATRGSEKLLLDDVIQRAKARNGYIGVSKHRNPKLGHYWLELLVMPYMIGDAVVDDNKGHFFYTLTKFVEFTKQNPKIYGDLTAEIETDKDIAVMLNGIGKLAAPLKKLLELYPEGMLVAYNPKWPVTEVQKLLQTLKGNEMDWCEMFFEYMKYVMSKKT
jgi:hypothetical protein